MKIKIYQYFAAGLSAILFLCLTMTLVAPFINKPSVSVEAPGDVTDENQNESNSTPSDTISPDEGESDNYPEENIPQEPEEVPETKNTATYVRSKVDGLNIRSGPGTNYSTVGYINKGDMVTLVEQEGSWYRTIYKNNTAYISAGSSYTDTITMKKSENETIEKVIEEGYQLLGFPYVYGATRYHDGNGNKIKGFNSSNYDCSSLTQFIYYHGANVNLNMTTRTQIVQGTHVPKPEIARGDLLFFTNSSRYNNTGIERVGHVAMYLGENYILHTASDFAVIEQISQQRWSYYLETRRFVEV